MKIKNYSGMMESFEFLDLQESGYKTLQNTKQDTLKYSAPGKKPKEKKPDYSQQRKQKRGD